VSRDFEIGTNVSCEESTVDRQSPCTELFFMYFPVRFPFSGVNWWKLANVFIIWSVIA